jgi:hypothetical protein
MYLLYFLVSLHVTQVGVVSDLQLGQLGQLQG